MKIFLMLIKVTKYQNSSYLKTFPVFIREIIYTKNCYKERIKARMKDRNNWHQFGNHFFRTNILQLNI